MPTTRDIFFRPGQRVAVDATYSPFPYNQKGVLATIRAIVLGSHLPQHVDYAIEFDEYCYGLHEAGGVVPSGKGWFVYGHALTLVQDLSLSPLETLIEEYIRDSL